MIIGGVNFQTNLEIFLFINCNGYLENFNKIKTKEIL